MAKVDDLLDKQDWGYEYQMSDYATSKADELEYEREGKEKIAGLKQALYKDMLELIGEDDTEVRGTTQNSTNPKYWTKRTKTKNELRQELRNKLKEYFGITE